jgi:hypothetical protein
MGTAHATETDVTVAGMSQHTAPGFNGFNPGIGARLANGALAWELGEYKNSYYRVTEYAIAVYESVHVGAWRAGAFAGAAVGYTEQQNRFRPAVAGLAANWQPGKLGLGIKVVPPAGPGTAGFIAVQLTVRVMSGK